MASKLHPDGGTDVDPHVPLPDYRVPWACQLCPLPLRNTRVHIEWESQDSAPDITEPRRAPEPPPARLPLP